MNEENKKPEEFEQPPEKRNPPRPLDPKWLEVLATTKGKPTTATAYFERLDGPGHCELKTMEFYYYAPFREKVSDAPVNDDGHAMMRQVDFIGAGFDSDGEPAAHVRNSKKIWRYTPTSITSDEIRLSDNEGHYQRGHTESDYFVSYFDRGLVTELIHFFIFDDFWDDSTEIYECYIKPAYRLDLYARSEYRHADDGVLYDLYRLDIPETDRDNSEANSNKILNVSKVRGWWDQEADSQALCHLGIMYDLDGENILGFFSDQHFKIYEGSGKQIRKRTMVASTHVDDEPISNTEHYPTSPQYEVKGGKLLSSGKGNGDVEPGSEYKLEFTKDRDVFFIEDKVPERVAVDRSARLLVRTDYTQYWRDPEDDFKVPKKVLAADNAYFYKKRPWRRVCPYHDHREHKVSETGIMLRELEIKIFLGENFSELGDKNPVVFKQSLNDLDWVLHEDGHNEALFTVSGIITDVEQELVNFRLKANSLARSQPGYFNVFQIDGNTEVSPEWPEAMRHLYIQIWIPQTG